MLAIVCGLFSEFFNDQPQFTPASCAQMIFVRFIIARVCIMSHPMPDNDSLPFVLGVCRYLPSDYGYPAQCDGWLHFCGVRFRFDSDCEVLSLPRESLPYAPRLLSILIPEHLVPRISPSPLAGRWRATFCWGRYVQHSAASACAISSKAPERRSAASWRGRYVEQEAAGLPLWSSSQAPEQRSAASWRGRYVGQAAATFAFRLSS